MKKFNQELLKLYQSNWNSLSEKLEEIKTSALPTKPTNPLLIRVGNEEKYFNSDIRVMIFGQETNDWGNDFQNNIENTLSIYDDFFNSNYCFKYGGQFWNGISRFLKILEDQNPNKAIEFVWNNVVKIGKSGGKGMPPNYIYQIEQENFSILKNEVEILEPNLILFLSGPNYDSILSNQFDNPDFEKIENYSQRQIAKIKLENIDFTFRTYHPNFLWRNGINDYFNEIINTTI
jgi:hypothetical protein